MIATTDPRVADAVRGWFRALRPPARLSLSAWAAEHARLEDGSRYIAFPFQRDLMDAFTDPEVRQVSMKKSARVGYSKIVQNLIGFTMHHHPRRVVVYQPTIDDAEDYSKTDVAALLSTPVLESLFGKTRDGSNTIRTKFFPGGSLRIKGANSPKEFRRITADVVILEEPDGYPPTAGLEGDQVELAFKRALTSDEPLKVAGSTPTIDGFSKIDALFMQGTQEYRYVPCPHCGEHQVLVFGDGTGPGIRWEPKDAPTRAWYVCVSGCIIEQHELAGMDERGEWRARCPQNFPHRSFHVWAGYSQFPNATWLEIAKEFVRVRKDPNKLRVFVNQTLGETFRVKGEAPDWRRLYDRREDYRPGIVPAGGLILTIGVDVQKDRVEAFVWAWGRGRSSWFIEKRVLMGTPFTREPWDQLVAMLAETWIHESGVPMRPAKVMIDAGFATTEVAAFCRRYPKSLVYPVKGASTLNAPPLSSPKAIDVVTSAGSKRRALKVWLVGDHVLKQELYGLLSLEMPTAEALENGARFPDGFVHLSHEADEEVCRQLVAEEWDEARGEWRKTGPNEALDGWKYARAGAIAAGIERMKESDWQALENTFPDVNKAPAATLLKPPQKNRSSSRSAVKSIWMSR